MSGHKTSILRIIKLGGLKLSKSEQKVADYVLANTALIPTMNLKGLSQAANVSEPTVVRFCRNVGTSGFQDFKIQVAQTLAVDNPSQPLDLQPNESLGSLHDKLIDIAQGNVQGIAGADCLENVRLAATAMTQADRIVVSGFGDSAGLAQDTYYKLYRLCDYVHYFTDAHMAEIALGQLHHEDVFIAISCSGTTKVQLDACLNAKQQGALVVAITNENTPLASLADFALVTQPAQQFGLYTTLCSRIGQMILIDSLLIATALQFGEGIGDRLKRNKRATAAVHVANRQHSFQSLW